MATTAHSVYDKHADKVVVANRCRAEFFNDKGVMADSVAVDKIASRWSLANYTNDTSNDFAILKLSRRPNVRFDFPPLNGGQAVPEVFRIETIGYHDGIPSGMTIVRRQTGIAVRPSSPAKLKELWQISAAEGQQMNNPENLYLADFDSTTGNSGAPILDGTGTVVGISGGGLGSNYRQFNVELVRSRHSANRILLFDAKFVLDLKALMLEE